MSHSDEAIHTTPVTGGSESPALTMSDLFHILQCERRRLVLRYLQDRNTTVSISALAEQVAAWQYDSQPEELSSSQRQRVYVDLYQSQLVKLDDQGLVNYNQSRGEVERTSAVDLFDPYLSAPTSDEDDEDAPAETESEPEWFGYYLGTTVISFLLVALASLGPVGPVAVSFSVAAVAVVGLQLATVTGLLASRHT